MFLVAQVSYAWIDDLLQATPTADLARLQLQQSVRLLDRRGNELYRLTNGEDRTSVRLADLPHTLLDAVVAIEDERFWDRQSCFDLRAITRAALRNFQAGTVVEGASTITQQLVRGVYLTPERSLNRKLQELILACRLEAQVPREEILELYLNRTAFGSNAFGVEQASQTFFGIPARDLTLAQVAVLAALPQRPSSLSPYGPLLRTAVERDWLERLRTGEISAEDLPPEAVQTGLIGRTAVQGGGNVRIAGRAELVLEAMERQGKIDAAQRRTATEQLDQLTFRAITPTTIRAPHFVWWANEQVQELADGTQAGGTWTSAGLRVTTTLDPTLQRLAQDAVSDLMPNIEARYGAKNVALVALDRETREVLAYVGNRDYFDNQREGQVDMVRAPRQPGSSFKPLVYATLFQRGYGPDDLISDLPLELGTSRPKNFEGGYLGWLTVRNALAMSRNLPAIRAFFAAGGEEAVLRMAAALGAPTPLEMKLRILSTRPGFTYGWPLAIGSAEVPLLELTNAYATLSSEGVVHAPVAVQSVEGNDGQTLYRRPIDGGVQALDPEAAAGVDDILRDANARPEGPWRNVLTIGSTRNGAKTGTSNLCFRRGFDGNCLEYGVSNVWTLGYTDNLVVGVWVGNADATPLANDADGLNVAAPIWHRFLQEAQRAWLECERGRCEVA
jgi:membrane peptidoglycan carboxypeptidase